MSAAIVDFYERTLEDQRAWSRELNLHFGYYRPRDEPSRPRTAPRRDQRTGHAPSRDRPSEAEPRARRGLGCGATARHVGRVHVASRGPGDHARARSSRAGQSSCDADGLHPRVRLVVGDYLARSARRIGQPPPMPSRARVTRRAATRRAVPGARPRRSHPVVASSSPTRSSSRRPLPPLPRRLHEAMCRRWRPPSLAVIGSRRSSHARASGF